VVGAAIVAIPLVLAAWWLAFGVRSFVLLLLLDILPLALFAILGAATGLIWDVLFRLPKNDFGICTGTGPVGRPNPDQPPQDDAGVVHVAIGEDEGGLNLSMPPEIVEAVGERGNCAGELLTARFAPNPGLDPKTKKPIRLTWDNHRWVRYRSFIAALELAARRFHASWTNVGEARPWRPYYDLLHRQPGEKPSSYPL